MRYRFADCELDTERYALTRTGQVIRLRPKVFQVLVYLLTHRERVVTKQELSEDVWAAQVTSDAALETGIRAVRRAVGDSGRKQQIIRTHHGHGYQFIAPVTVLAKAFPATSSIAADMARLYRHDPPVSASPCFACGYIPRGHATFCIVCGTRFWQYCARCGHMVALPASQCAACAWPVTDIAPARYFAAQPSGSRLAASADASVMASSERGVDNELSAVSTWQRAGQEAFKRAAYTESVRCFRTALGCLPSLSSTADRQRLDLQLHLALGNALMPSKGYTAPEVGAIYVRVRDLGEAAGDMKLRFAALRGLRRFYENRGDLQQARSCGEQLLSLAQRSRKTVDLQEAHYSLGHTLYSLGELHLATSHLRQGAALIDPEQRDSVCLHLICHDLMASCLWLMGYPDQALHQMRQMLPLAQACAGPLTLVHVFFHTAQVHQWRQEAQAAQKWIQDLITLATHWSLPHWLTAGMNLQAWALTQQGRVAEGVEQLHEGVSACRERNAYMACQPPLALLAEAYGETGEIDKGLRVVDESFEIAAQASGHWREAELYRLKGDLLAAQDHTKRDAEVCFQHALDMTRAQGAKSLELRVAMSLSRLWQQQGKRGAACQLLTDRYTWFTEGFETRDLRAARAQLATLV